MSNSFRWPWLSALDCWPLLFSGSGEGGLAESVLELKPQPRALDLPRNQGKAEWRGRYQSHVKFVFTLLSWLHLSVYKSHVKFVFTLVSWLQLSVYKTLM